MKSKQIKTHRFVAYAFLVNTNNYKEINHINSDKKDNRAENLEWCTRSENMSHMISEMGPGHRLGMSNPKTRLVVHGEYGIFCTIREAAAMIPVEESNLNHMLHQRGYRKNRTKFILV
jgi:hypothetical protein